MCYRPDTSVFGTQYRRRDWESQQTRLKSLAGDRLSRVSNSEPRNKNLARGHWRARASFRQKTNSQLQVSKRSHPLSRGERIQVGKTRGRETARELDGEKNREK